MVARFFFLPPLDHYHRCSRFIFIPRRLLDQTRFRSLVFYYFFPSCSEDFVSVGWLWNLIAVSSRVARVGTWDFRSLWHSRISHSSVRKLDKFAPSQLLRYTSYTSTLIFFSPKIKLNTLSLSKWIAAMMISVLVCRSLYFSFFTTSYNIEWP